MVHHATEPNFLVKFLLLGFVWRLPSIFLDWKHFLKVLKNPSILMVWFFSGVFPCLHIIQNYRNGKTDRKTDRHCLQAWQQINVTTFQELPTGISACLSVISEQNCSLRFLPF